MTPDDLKQKHSDALLLDAARAGDRGALERLLEQYQRQVLRFGIKMCGDEEDAKDVLQETLLAAARNLSSFRGDSSLSTWLYTIARSFCLKRRRRSRFAPAREQSLSDDDGRHAARVPDPGQQPDETLAAREMGQQLDEAIAALDPLYREVLVLRDIEGLTAPEVATVLGIGVDAVKSRLHRARATMRGRLAPALGAAEGAAPSACPDVVELLSRELEGEISADLCAKMESHLAQCPRCRGRCDGMKRVLAVCAAAPLPTVPTNVQEALRRAIRDLRHTL